MYTPVSVMRTPSVLEENDNREWMWLGSEILLRVGRSRSSVRHNSFLWSLAPLRFVLYVKGNIPCTDGRPLRRSASASVVGMSLNSIRYSCQIITCNSCNPGLVQVRPGLVRVDPGLVREYGVVSLDEVPLRLDLI